MQTIGLFLAGALIVSACSTSGEAPQRTDAPSAQTVTTSQPTAPPQSTTPSSTIQQPDGSEEATVIKVFDGDSMLVAINGRQEEIRLLGINAPERDECFGPEAGDRLRELAGSTVGLIADGEDTDRFGRLLRLVFTSTSFVNADLVEGGYAIGLQDRSTLSGEMKQLEDSAFEGAVGMWGWDVCGDIPGDLEISDTQPNAPGPDDENLNQEWIAIRNNGSDPVELQGFIVRDESSSHRFSFPAGFVLPTGAIVRVHTGCGTNTSEDVFWCNDTSVWSNGGDTILFQTPDGGVIDRLVYTDS